MSAAPDPARALLRHTVATVAYRGGKAVRGASPRFADFRAADGSRTPAQILAHIGDLFEWALWLAKGKHVWKDTAPQPWDEEIARFHATLERFDAYLDSSEPLACAPAKLFQGPIADALTHVGQIAMLRRVVGEPMRGENYFRADIEAGRVGAEQARPKVEFD